MLFPRSICVGEKICFFFCRWAIWVRETGFCLKLCSLLCTCCRCCIIFELSASFLRLLSLAHKRAFSRVRLAIRHISKDSFISSVSLRIYTFFFAVMLFVTFAAFVLCPAKALDVYLAELAGIGNPVNDDVNVSVLGFAFVISYQAKFDFLKSVLSQLIFTKLGLLSSVLMI